MTRTNTDRANEGLELCETLQAMTGADTLQDQITDIIAQLMHTARLKTDEQGKTIDFEACLASARMHFAAEVDEDPDTEAPECSNCGTTDRDGTGVCPDCGQSHDTLRIFAMAKDPQADNTFCLAASHNPPLPVDHYDAIEADGTEHDDIPLQGLDGFIANHPHGTIDWN